MKCKDSAQNRRKRENALAPIHKDAEWTAGLKAFSEMVGVDSLLQGSASMKDSVADPITGKDVPVLEFCAFANCIDADENEPRCFDLDRLRALARHPVADEDGHHVDDRLALCSLKPEPQDPAQEVLMHAVLPKKHVVRLFAVSIETVASLKNAESVVREIYDSTCAWMPWQQSGIELARIADEIISKHKKNLVGIILQSGGLITWGATEQTCRQNARTLIAKAAQWLEKKTAASKGRHPAGPAVYEIAENYDRHARAAALAPVIRGLCGGGQHLVGAFRDDAVIIDLSLRKKARQLLRFALMHWGDDLRAGLRPVLIDLAPESPLAEVEQRLREEVERYGKDAAACLKNANQESLRPRLVLVAGVGLFSFAPEAAAARRLGESYLRHMHAVLQAESIRGCQGLSAMEIATAEHMKAEREKIKASGRKPLAGKIALVTGGASGIGLATAHRLLAEGACVAIADFNRDHLTAQCESLGREFGADQIHGVFCDVTDPTSIEQAFADLCLRWGGLDILVNNAGLSLSRSLEDTSPEDYDRQNAVMPRGGFLCSRSAAGILRKQDLGGDIVYVASKNGLYAGPNNVAYGTAKAAQIHQARLVAADLAAIQVRVNVVNPDAVVQGSGIFSGGWGADRAKAYGIKEEDLGKYYAQRTLLRREILPSDIAAAVFTLVGPDLRKSTALVINVDGGFAPAMLR